MAIVSTVKPEGSAGSEYPIASNLYGTCSTAAGTAAKQVTLINSWSTESGDPPIGLTVHVKFTNANTAVSPTLQVGAYTAKPVCSNGTTRVWNFDSGWADGGVASFTFDGTSWIMNDFIENSDYRVNQYAASDNDTHPLLLKQYAGSTDGLCEAVYNSNVWVNPSNGYFSAVKVSTDGSNFYEIGAAAEKAIGSVADNDTGLVTGDAVYDAIQAIQAGAMTYVGGVASLTDASHPLMNSAIAKGEVYAVTTSFTISDGAVTHTLEVGDLIIVNTSGTYTTQSALYAAIDIIQQNLDVLTTTDIDNAIDEAEAA